MRRLHIMAIIVLFASCSSCTKEIDRTAKLNLPNGGLIKKQTIDTFPVQIKSINGRYARAAIISVIANKASYTLVDKYFSVIKFGTISVQALTPIEEVKQHIFTSFGLEDLKPMSFIKLLKLGYNSFGNWIYQGDEKWGWLARNGTTHLHTGSIFYSGFSSLDGGFTNDITMPKLPYGQDIRGGSYWENGDSAYAFVAIYNSIQNKFIRLSLFKSHLNNISWGAEKVLLYCVGTNGGINETTGNRFNFHGKPLFENGKLYITWFEHNGAGTWRTNYFYSEDNFATYEIRNIPQLPSDDIGEQTIESFGNGTLISLGRKVSRSPQYQSTSTDGITWSQWQKTNIGSGKGQVMSAMKYTKEHGLVVVYGDRGTSTMKISINNDANTIVSNPLGYKEGKVIFTSGSGDPFKPLGYPSIEWVSPYNFLIGFSIEESYGSANFYAGIGNLNQYQ